MSYWPFSHKSSGENTGFSPQALALNRPLGCFSHSDVGAVSTIKPVSVRRVTFVLRSFRQAGRWPRYLLRNKLS